MEFTSVELEVIEKVIWEKIERQKDDDCMIYVPEFLLEGIMEKLRGIGQDL
ncbi:MAG: hypothetical protein E6X43_15070 [Peptostreptococcaceae bacterium]|nr:hypothetical protein [Peptostreptococcaceae bacterium]